MARGALRVLATALVAVGLVAAVAACGTGGSPGVGPTVSGSATPGPDGVGVIGSAPEDDELTCTSTNDTPGVAVIVERNRLVLADGRAYPLTEIPGGATGGYQTCDGWLVHGGTGPYSLWLVRLDGSIHPVVTEADAEVAVAADGKHIAWRWNDRLNTARVNPTDATTIDVSSPISGRGHPISLTESVVVLGYSSTGGGIDNHDVWTPARGDYVPTWSEAAHVRVLYGPAPDGVHVLGLVDNPGRSDGRSWPCLAVLDPRRSLAADRTACGPPFAYSRFHDIDPDGRRLAVVTADESGDRALGLVDLTTVFDTPAFVAVLSGPPATGGAFEDATHVLVTPEGRGLARSEFPFTSWSPADRPGVTASTRVTALLPRLV